MESLRPSTKDLIAGITCLVDVLVDVLRSCRSLLSKQLKLKYAKSIHGAEDPILFPKSSLIHGQCSKTWQAALCSYFWLQTWCFGFSKKDMVSSSKV